jgi:hypothetical protein
MFSDSYIARLNFIHTDHTALAYRSIEPPFTKPSSYASVIAGKPPILQVSACSILNGWSVRVDSGATSHTGERGHL